MRTLVSHEEGVGGNCGGHLSTRAVAKVPGRALWRGGHTSNGHKFPDNMVLNHWNWKSSKERGKGILQLKKEKPPKVILTVLPGPLVYVQTTSRSGGTRMGVTRRTRQGQS